MPLLTNEITRPLREEGVHGQDEGWSQGETPHSCRQPERHTVLRHLNLDLEHLVGCVFVLLGAGAAAVGFVAGRRHVVVRAGLVTGAGTDPSRAAVTAAREAGHGSERSIGLETTDGDEVRRASRSLARRVWQGTEPIAGIPPPDRITRQ